MEAEIVFLRDQTKSKNKIINNLLLNLNKPQNLSYNESNKTFSNFEENRPEMHHKARLAFSQILLKSKFFLKKWPFSGK